MSESPSTVTVFSPDHMPTTILTTEVQVADGILRIFAGQYPVAMYAPGSWTHFVTDRIQVRPSVPTVRNP